NNFNENLFSKRENYARDLFLEYYQGDKSCPGCPNDCIKYLNPDPENVPKEVTGIHQEVTGTMGPNIGNGNLRLMLESNVKCNLYRSDPGSLGFKISIAMESFENGLINKKDTGGLKLTFGNEESIIPLIKAIANREGFGDILAEGSKRAAEKIGKDSDFYALH